MNEKDLIVTPGAITHQEKEKHDAENLVCSVNYGRAHCEPPQCLIPA